MRIKLIVEVNKEDREKLAASYDGKKPADYATCKATLLNAIEAEIDSWYLEAAEKRERERDSDREYKEYKTEKRDRDEND